MQALHQQLPPTAMYVLVVAEGNDRAVRLYERHGLEEQGRVSGHDYYRETAGIVFPEGPQISAASLCATGHSGTSAPRAAHRSRAPFRGRHLSGTTPGRQPPPCTSRAPDDLHLRAFDRYATRFAGGTALAADPRLPAAAPVAGIPRGPQLPRCVAGELPFLRRSASGLCSVAQDMEKGTRDCARPTGRRIALQRIHQWRIDFHVADSLQDDSRTGGEHA